MGPKYGETHWQGAYINVFILKNCFQSGWYIARRQRLDRPLLWREVKVHIKNGLTVEAIERCSYLLLK